MTYVSDHLNLPSHNEAVRRFLAMMNDLNASRARVDYTASNVVSTTEGANRNGPALDEHDVPSNMDLDPVWNQNMQAGLPGHLPQAQTMAYTIADGEDLGFGSDASDVEEAPSDYAEEFHSWEVFGDEDVPEATQEDAQSSRSTKHDWEPFRSQEVMLYFGHKPLKRMIY
jgi:hypothetical protein